MNIAQITSGGGKNGATVNCALVTQSLARRGHKVVLVHRPGAWIGQEVALPAVDRLESQLRRNYRDVRNMADELRRRRIDVIHTHMSSANAFGMILKILGFPRVATAHGSYIQPHWLFNDRLIAPCHESARFHHRFNLVPNRRIRITPYFVDEDHFRPPGVEERCAARSAMGVGEHDFLIVSIGAITRRKRQSVLAEAFARLHQQSPNTRLCLIGPLEDQRELSLTKAALAEVADAVQIVGEAPDVRRFLQAADAFALSSTWEGGPLAVIEAQACGLPVVSTSVGDVGEFISEGRSGFVVPVGDVTALCERLQRLAQNPDLARSMGRFARDRVISQYGIEAGVDRVEAVLREAAHGPR